MKKTNTILIFTLFLFHLNSYSQYDWAELVLPDSIISYQIAFDSSNKHFIATNHGIYISEDGYQWEQSSLTEGVGRIYINENNTIYAGGISLFRSFDDGLTWDTIFNCPGCGVGPIYTISDSSIFIGIWGGIYRSIDSGQSWEYVLEVYNSEVCNAIVSNSEGVLFAGTTAFVGGGSPGGVYKSANNGLTWQLSNLDYHFVSDIVINSSDEIFVGTRGHFYTGEGNVLKSNDEGATWSSVFEHIYINTMDINCYNELVLGCDADGSSGGIFISTDSGENWEEITNNLPSNSIYFISFDIINYVYAITQFDYNLYKTETVVAENEKLTSNTISFFPNPTINELKISNGKKSNNIIITDISGKTVFNLTPDTNNDLIIIDVSRLKSGLYFIYQSDKFQNNVISKFIKY